MTTDDLQEIWICESCHAEGPGKAPKQCPLCGQYKRGFSQAEKEAQHPEDQKHSLLYEETLETLKSYDEGCAPEKLCYFCQR